MNVSVPSRSSFDWHPSIKPSLPLSPVDIQRLEARRRPARGSREWNPGLGQSGTALTEQGISLATTGVAVGATIAGATAIGAIAGPIGAIAGALVALLSSVFKGCGSSCTLTSDAANQVEQLLQQNLQAYMSSGHTQAEQAAALANFNNTWAQLEQYCGQASFGTAGENCISDREAGACHYKTSTGGWQQTNGQWNYVYPGAEGSGSTCWNWFVGYHDPIANDPTVVANAASPTSASASGTGTVSDDIDSIWSELTGGGSNYAPLLLIGGILLLAVLL